MNRLERQLERALETLGLKVNKEQRSKLLQYIGLLLAGLQRQRLVGEKDGAAFIEKQLVDVLYPFKLMGAPPPGRRRLLDLGTGAGLPGIPLKICFPELELTLLDANRRKINFNRRVAAELGLPGVHFLPGRAEKWGRHPDYREQFDCAVSRAVARAAVLAELALPLVQVGGVLVMYKGKQGLQEIEEAGTAIRLCGGRLERSWCYQLPTGEKRTLFRIVKDEQTPPGYPRRSGKPAQRPLGG
ncbi:MAG: 16S rRNA (guanine(527)-N(7))-methyltransferase RsmG [Firmicutes bacterium]|nr:16S rRNA (guanine(527)-N(7))-methyltransferase RsmG [Bacillota bacterium]